VRYAELDYLAQAYGTPNDPSFSRQWNMTKINAPAAWDVSSGSASTTIAIVDTGIDLAHPDLQSKIVAGYDFVNNDSTAQDDEGHGTHCAGIAAALSNNAVGVAGVNWQARLMPVKVLDNQGSGSFSNVASGITWAADHGATVISMSLGGSGVSDALRDAVNYAYSRGVIIVAAAGNEYTQGNPVSYPAALEHVIGVAATTTSDGHAYYSNTGFYVDIAAPGGDSSGSIYSTLWNASGSTYGTMSGTSMATPHVAGLAAMLKGINGSLTPEAVEWVMQYTAVDLGAAGRDDVFGWGRINMLAAVNAAGNPQPTPTPTVSPCLIESPHPYANNLNQTWTVNNPDASAGYSRVHFMRIELESCCDVIEVLDGAGRVIQSIRSDYPGGLWSDAVPGAVVKVRLRTDYSVVKWGFCVDAIETIAGGPTVTPTPTITPTGQPSNCLAQSPHPYANNYSNSWTLTNPDAAAAYSRVHFSRLETESCCDFVSVRAPGGAEIARYGGTRADFWSAPAPGNRVEVRFTTDSSVTAWGFCIDAIETTAAPPWTMHAPLTVPRSRLAVVAAGDYLYAIGGESAAAAAGDKGAPKVASDLDAGDAATQGMEVATERYDPAANAWTRMANKPTGVSNTSAAVINGRIYMAGGFLADETPSDVLQIYDPAANTWNSGPALPQGRFAHASAALDGKLYILGGQDDISRLNTGHVFDTATNQWSAIAPMSVARAYAGAGVVGGKVYVVGGLDSGGSDMNSAEVYDPATNSWSALPAMSAARGGPGVAGVGTELYVVGGGFTTYLSSGEIYSPTTNLWRPLDDLNAGRRTVGLALLNQRVYAVGGYNGNYVGMNESHAAAGGAPTPTPTRTVTPTVTRTVLPTFTPTITPTSFPGDAIVRIAPPNKSVNLSGGPFTLTVAISDVNNLGGFQFDVNYDQTVISPTQVSLAPFLGSAGRTASPVGPTYVAGRLTFGAFSFGSAAGPSGSGALAVITFAPVAEGTTAVTLGNVSVTTANAGAISVAMQNGQVRVTRCPYDLDGNGRVDIMDIMLVASHWGCRSGDACYDARYDLDEDGDIDIVDIMRVAAAWGTTCGPIAPAAVRPAGAGKARREVIARVEPAKAQAGDTYSFAIVLENAQDLGAFEFTLAYDPALLTPLRANLGPMLSGAGRTAVRVGPDFRDGRIVFGGFAFGQGAGPNGSGVVATVTFRAKGAGASALELLDLRLASTSARPEAPADLIGAALTVRQE
jgi:thermitase